MLLNAVDYADAWIGGGEYLTQRCIVFPDAQRAVRHRSLGRGADKQGVVHALFANWGLQV
ncbi:MAG: hypothetical protein ABI767_12035 [Rhodanobacter sp.]